jgi:hypothetical protein
MISDPAKAMESQFWFARRLKDHGITVYFAGLTDVPDRWEVIRSAIVTHGLADVAMSKTSSESYRSGYERAVGLPLIPAQGVAA